MQQLTIGTLLRGGSYKIEKVLGQGSFGITYLAEHTNLGRKVAIKEFFMKELNSRGEDGSITGMTDGSLSQNYCVKFQKEAINLSRLDHPNIVRVTDSFSENGTFYYVMDYIEGQNLNDYVKSHHVDEAEATSIIKSVADALIYMHEEKHMLHLDLKPGNVMRRNSDGHIFLIDFGLSKHFSEDGQPETSTTIGLGTAGYAPIEQGNKAKNGEFRPTIDVYALGATFYKLLTRETPPPASDLVSDDELLENNLRVKGVSDNFVKIVVEAMFPNVRKRTQTIRDFKSNLDGIKAEANPTTNNVSSNETIVGTDKDETIVTSANNSSDSEETALASPAVQDEKSRLVKEYMEAFKVEEEDALLYVNTHGMKATTGAIAAKKGENTTNSQTPTNGKVNSPKTVETTSYDSKAGVVVAITIILFFAFLFGMTRGCGNKTASTLPNANADSDTVVLADTVDYESDTQKKTKATYDTLPKNETRIEKAYSAMDKLLVGKHLFAIQWISLDKFGYVNITKTEKNDVYNISGIQDGSTCSDDVEGRKNGDFIKIHGTITAEYRDQLRFNGKIIQKSYQMNNGQPFSYSGEYYFIQLEGKHYWRMGVLGPNGWGMGVLSPDGFTTYIDIFLK